ITEASPMQSVNRILLILAGLTVCGAVYAAQGSIPVSEDLGIRFEAVDGTQGPPESLRLIMVNPPSGLSRLDLEDAISPLLFAADCGTQQVRIHDQDSLIDTDWSPAQNGNFEFSLNSPSIRVVNDGAGHSNCMADVSLHIRGKLDCHNVNAPGLSAEIAYQFLESRSVRGPAKMCRLPQGSYLYGNIK
ncbi:MAG: hypothetical protein ACJ763_13025, partial [Bdellovibrionia bacterium]